MRKRVIPVLLMDSKRRLIKTVGFGDRTYIGDPFNVVRLFNEREVDEICLLDIDASAERRGPDIPFLAKFAAECFMPFSYGGGLSSLGQCRDLNRLGIEKFIVTSNADNASFCRELVSEFGTQAISTAIDYKGCGASAQTLKGEAPLQVAKRRVDAGFGEIILQSIDRDGARNGYDLETIREVASSVDIPVIALGGAGGLEHLRPPLEAGASAAASGSAFTFIGRLRAVLITYPGQDDLERIAGGLE